MSVRHRGRPRGRTKEETRARILAAGRACFGTYGYDAASNRLIAEAAGISAASIYSHFASKRDLYRAVAEDARRFVLEEFLLGTMRATTARQALLGLLNVSRRVSASDPSVARFVVAYPVEVRRHAELAELPVDFLAEADLRAILVRAGAESDLAEGVDIADATESLFILFMGLGRLAQATSSQERWQATAEACEHLVAAKAQPKRAPSRPGRRRAASPPVAPAPEEPGGLTRRRLLDAAVETFAERGYASAALHEVAERAGLTTGAVYANFESKQDLFVAAVRDTAQVMETALRPWRQTGSSLADRAAAYIEGVTVLCTTQPVVQAFRSVVHVELVKHPELAVHVGDEVGRRLAFCRAFLDGAASPPPALSVDDMARLLMIVEDSLAWFVSVHGPLRPSGTVALKALLAGNLLR